MNSGVVFDIKRFAIHDGPGIRTTIFFKGCPLSCWWCHNPEGISSAPELMYIKRKCIACKTCVANCPSGAITLEGKQLILNRKLCSSCGVCAEMCPTGAIKLVGKQMSTEEILKELNKDILFFNQSQGGVTVSGGEPLMQVEFLKELLERLKHLKVHTVVDTCGYAERKSFELILPYVDLFLYDLKIVDDAKHKKYTGVSNEKIRENLEFLLQSEKSVLIRVPIVPAINDSEEDIEDLMDYLEHIGIKSNIHLLPFHNISEKYDMLGKKFKLTGELRASYEKISFIESKMKANGFHVKIGG